MPRKKWLTTLTSYSVIGCKGVVSWKMKTLIRKFKIDDWSRGNFKERKTNFLCGFFFCIHSSVTHCQSRINSFETLAKRNRRRGEIKIEIRTKISPIMKFSEQLLAVFEMNEKSTFSLLINELWQNRHWLHILQLLHFTITNKFTERETKYVILKNSSNTSEENKNIVTSFFELSSSHRLNLM